MAIITKKDIQHIAKLSNLKLTPNEEETFTKHLDEVVDYIDNLKEVNTENIEPTSQTTDLENKTRKDKIEETDFLKQKQALSGTDKFHNGYFVVPGIIEEKTSNDQ